MRRRFYKQKIFCKWNVFLLKALLICSNFCLSGSPAFALTVQPVILDMASAGPQSRSSITVTNESANPVPVEIEIFKIELDTRGEKSEAPSQDDFLVFPPQAIIKPGASQLFRLQWVGQPDIARSQSYNFSVNQTPVKLAQNTSGVQIVFNFAVIVNVAPPAGNALLKYVKSEISPGEKGERWPAITVENHGNMHAYLSDALLTLDAGTFSKTYGPGELRHLIGLGLVQPGKRRQFLLPVSLPADVKSVNARVDYKPRKPPPN